MIRAGARVRISGAPDWPGWRRPAIGATGTILDPPRALTGPGPVRCGLLWFEIDAALHSRIRTDMFVRAHEVELIDAAA